MFSSAIAFDKSPNTVVSAVEAIPTDLAVVRELDDAALLQAQHRIAAARTKLDACASLLAGETGYRSRHDLGLTGLAQREGFRTPEALVQHTTGSSTREATTLVTVGTMIRDAITGADSDSTGSTNSESTEAEPHEPWLTAVGTAVNSGAVSAECARAIRTGLGQPTSDAASTADTEGPGVTPEMRATAATRLLQESGELNVDELLKRARELRDELDEAGIAAREKAIDEQRSFRRVQRSNGVSRFILDPDLETGAYLDDLYDKITSPRRGGPRFIDPEDQAWAKAVANDERSLDQYLHDSVTALLRLGVGVDLGDTHTIVGPRIPAVRVLTTASALSGTSTAVPSRSSSATAARSWISAANNASSPRRKRSRSAHATVVACGPAATVRPVPPKPITSTSGTAIMGTPMSPSASSSADIIICCSTTTTGTSSSGTAATG